ncbi:hypothetical protein HHI36_019478 [Cryptolaemus montrouzieri]|uniref:Peptidase S1 domain-containing protein n=1 Tax=Cryptolaemus montrouzieri TaxID=559131 RepID=A0ABD2P3V2_9CUCU
MILALLIGHGKNGQKLKCSGTLIKLDTILTAAHCVVNLRRSIFAEPEAILHTPQGRRSIRGKKIFVHQKYHRVDMQYDIAIVKLEESFLPSEASLVTLPNYHENKEPSYFCQSGLVIGWGNTHIATISDKPKKSYFGQSFRCIQLPVISNNDCRILRSSVKLESHFCAFPGFNDSGGGCVGDSGGPFICGGVQYGIASLNFGCGVQGEPTYFTRIDKVLSFINENVASSGMWLLEHKKSHYIILFSSLC